VFLRRQRPIKPRAIAGAIKSSGNYGVSSAHRLIAWAMSIEIASGLIAQLQARVAAATQQEICGLMLGEGNRVDHLVYTTNVAADPARAFEIEPAALIAAHRAMRSSGGPAIIGYFHSHPNGGAVPSVTDAAMAAPDGRYWLIAAQDAIAVWQAVPEGSIHGRFLPVPLVISGATRQDTMMKNQRHLS
jgi:proteasome lid subunit RPN8/RPN11